MRGEYFLWEAERLGEKVSSPYARGILATLMILARSSFEYNVIGFWVIIHISVYLASTFLVFLNRRKNTVFALLAIFGVVAPYFAIITAKIFFFIDVLPYFWLSITSRSMYILPEFVYFSTFVIKNVAPLFKIISVSSLKVLWLDSPSPFEPLPFPNAENGVHSRIRGKIPWETGMAGWVLRFIPVCAGVCVNIFSGDPYKIVLQPN